MEIEPFWHHFWTFSFFQLCDQKIRFLGEKLIKNCPKKSHESSVNLIKKWKQKTAISLALRLIFCVKIIKFAIFSIIYPDFGQGGGYFWWVHQIYDTKSDFLISKNQKLLISPKIIELEPFRHHFWTFSFFELFVLKICFLGENRKLN